jgi:hypothetical protein
LRPEVTDDSRLAQARERFLTGEPTEPGQVRDTILASWRRSREWHVAADRIDPSYVRAPDLDTALLRAVHRRRNPAGGFHALDAADAGDDDWMVRALSELLQGEGSLVIRQSTGSAPCGCGRCG